MLEPAGDRHGRVQKAAHIVSANKDTVGSILHDKNTSRNGPENPNSGKKKITGKTFAWISLTCSQIN